MFRQVLTSIAIALFVVLTAGSCNFYGASIKVLCYNNVEFSTRGNEFDGMSVQSTPLPDYIAVILPDGQRLQMSDISLEKSKQLFGAPTLSLADGIEGKIERYGRKGCTIRFTNDNFSMVSISEGCKVENTLNQKSLSFPASESEIRNVFGTPTEVARRQLTNLPP